MDAGKVLFGTRHQDMGRNKLIVRIPLDRPPNDRSQTKIMASPLQGNDPVYNKFVSCDWKKEITVSGIHQEP